MCNQDGKSWGPCVCGPLPDAGRKDGAGSIYDSKVSGCSAGTIRCSDDGYGMNYCGYDGKRYSYGIRVPCDASEKCTAGKCSDSRCNNSEVIILLDRSSSMSTTWTWVSQTVLAAIKAREGQNYFGFREFPHTSACNVSPLISPALRAHDRIKQAMSPPTIGASTPIGAAMDIESKVFGDPSISQAVILITDGDETCGTQQAALQSASNLFFKGVYVFTVAVTTTANITLVDKIAGVGGTQKSRLVSDAGGLKRALDEIFVRLKSCKCVDGCLIDGACHAPNALNPSNSCQVCDPARSTTAWSRSDKGCLIGGKCYADGALNPSNNCQKCDLSISPSAWSPSGRGCLIGGTCYNDGALNPSNNCQKCDLSISPSAWSPSGRGCLIGGTCYNDGALNPSNNCQKCDLSISPSAWSPSGKGCLIKNICYAANTVNPADKCQICDPTLSQTAWTLIPGCSGFGVYLHEVHLGSDYVAIRNNTSSNVDVSGWQVYFDDGRGTSSTYNWGYTIVSKVLKPGEILYLCESTSACSGTGTINMSNNIMYTSSTGSNTYLCKGTCSSTTLVDLHSYKGTSAGPTTPLFNGKFSPGPSTGITSSTESTHSFIRQAYKGVAPNCLQADWKVGTKTK